MKRKILKYILPFFILSALLLVSCFDMYNEILDNTGDKYRLAVAGTTIAATNSVIYFSDNKGGLSGPETIDTSFLPIIKSGFADFNKDGNLDLVFIQQNNSHILYFSDGKGNIKQGGSFPVPFASPASDGIIADIDNDGDPDLIITISIGANDYILVNDGNGNFTVNTVLTTQSSSVTADDFDKDNDVDLLLVTTLGKELWINNSGAFTQAYAAFGAGTTILEMLSADLDGDGDIDLIETNSVGQPIVWLNNGSGQFNPGWSTSFGIINRDLAIGDIDSDGDIDLFLRSDDVIDYFLINNGSGEFSVKNFTKPAAGFCYASEFGDLDLDGDIDLIVSDQTELRVYHNNGNGIFTIYKTYAPITPQSNISAGAIFR